MMPIVVMYGDSLEGEEEQQKSTLKQRPKWKSPQRLILLAVVIVVIIALILFAIFILPMLGHDGSMLVESDSMQHSDSGGQDGIIDHGDTIFYDKIDDKNDVKTYFEGKRQGYKKYGEYGDVIIYYKNGHKGTTPVIHRAIIWLEFNETANSFDVPELQYNWYGKNSEWYVEDDEERWFNLTGTIVLNNVGYDHEDVRIDLSRILYLFDFQKVKPHSGFITLGDHNGGNYDQGILRDPFGAYVEPVKIEWIAGKVTYLADK
ncbi:MAG: S26 family signal peptidase [Thermoplasmata archaeon]|nr:MAG: S26 family signal peptidase [Thermoplasmata archaeon]